MLVTSNKLIAASILALSLTLGGCVSSGTSVSGYGGPSITSVQAKRQTAKKEVREAAANLRKAERKLKKLERAIKRDTRRLKRKRGSAKRLEKAKVNLKKNKRELRSVKRTVRSAKWKLSRAEAREKRAVRAIATAKRRKADAERRFRDAEQRRKDAKKRKQLADARKQIERKDAKPELRSRVFALSDPALKNIDDYQARVDGGFPIAAIPVSKVSKRLYRQEVSYRTSHKAGTIVVDTGARYLYLVQRGGKAVRYGIGVGKAGFAWSGSAHIGWKQEWPKWTPPSEMIERRPELEKYSADNGGMPGGPQNPLGARALYLMKDGKDTLFRLHGTPQWASIGTAASSGCIRLMNQDVIDLYRRVPQGTKVVVL